MKHTTVIFVALFGAAKATDDDSAIPAASAPVDIQLRGAASSISKVDFWEDDVHKVYNDVEEVAVSTTEASNFVANFVLLPGSTYSRCPAGREVSQGACLAAANELTAGLTTITKRGTLYVNDWNWTPCGCFVYQDRLIDFDTNCGNAVTQADSDLVCKAESVSYENKKGANGKQGYCLPWGSSGGDLCREYSTLAVCGGSDSSFYLPDNDQSEVAHKCDLELKCKGYTWNTGNSQGKLKSAISGVQESGGYQCYEKEDQCIKGDDPWTLPNIKVVEGCKDTVMKFRVDQWVSGTSDEDTGDRVDAHFYKGGVEQACIYKNHVGESRGIYHRSGNDDSFIWHNNAGCTGEIIPDRVDLVIHGGDAMLIEYAYLKDGMLNDEGPIREWGTDDNGYAWCMSTDKDDWKGDWESSVQEKTCFQQLSFRENGKVYGSHSISEPWVCISFCG